MHRFFSYFPKEVSVTLGEIVFFDWLCIMIMYLRVLYVRFEWSHVQGQIETFIRHYRFWLTSWVSFLLLANLVGALLQYYFTINQELTMS